MNRQREAVYAIRDAVLKGRRTGFRGSRVQGFRPQNPRTPEPLNPPRWLGSGPSMTTWRKG